MAKLADFLKVSPQKDTFVQKLFFNWLHEGSKKEKTQAAVAVFIMTDF